MYSPCHPAADNSSLFRTWVSGQRTFPDLLPITGDNSVGKHWLARQAELSLSSILDRQMSSNSSNCMDYAGDDRYTADWGCVWLHGRSVQSALVRAWAAAWAERWLLTVTHSAYAVQFVYMLRYITANLTLTSDLCRNIQQRIRPHCDRHNAFTDYS